MPPNIPLQPTVKKLRFLPAAELARWVSDRRFELPFRALPFKSSNLSELILKKLITFTLAALLLGACATTANYTSKSMAVSMDMTKEQVVNLMGPPKRVSARKSNEGLIERYSWWSPKLVGFTPIDNEMIATDRVFVRFLNGKVVEWGDKYDFSENIDKSVEMQSELMKSLQKKTVEPATVAK